MDDMDGNGADGVSDIEGKAAREAASECGQRASFNGANGMSDMAEGWDHDLGGVFSGRAQRELPRYKADQLFTSANRARYQRQHVVGRRGDRKRITPLFSSPPFSWRR